MRLANQFCMLLDNAIKVLVEGEPPVPEELNHMLEKINELVKTYHTKRTLWLLSRIPPTNPIRSAERSTNTDT